MGPRVASALSGWPLALSVYWLAGFYFLWGLGFTGAAFAVVRSARRNSTRRWALPVALGYQLTLWALALGAYRASYARALWGRDLALTALFLAAVAFLARGKN